jgi:hypothetical protein
MTGFFGLGLLLRVVLRSQQRDYLGFWSWFFLVSLLGVGYGILCARRDRAVGISSRPISLTQNVVAGILAVSGFLIVWFTDNTSARMIGRYLVGLLVGALIAVDWAIRHGRQGG